MLLLTLKGTPFFFAGDEIGMPGVHIPKTAVQDVFEKLVPGYGLNRDPERSPMRWDGTPKGGFTSGKPWLCMGDDIVERNVLRQQKDTRSLLSLYRSLIALRKREPALRSGDYLPLRACKSWNAVPGPKRSIEPKQMWNGLKQICKPPTRSSSGLAGCMGTRTEAPQKVPQAKPVWAESSTCPPWPTRAISPLQPLS